LPVKIYLQNITYVGTRSLEGTHVAEHGESGREGTIGDIERYVKNGSGIYYAVDGFEVIFRWGRLLVSFLMK
jgi:hypothetical protein